MHIEVAKDLTTHSFLNCLKRFISRRGKPSSIHSDNGLNFVGANNYFLDLYNLLNDTKHNETVATFLADDQISWKFIPARSPHMGGLWEAAVKSAKFHLRRVLGESVLSYEDMYTLLVQIEACLNSRPLQPLSTDISDLTPLTPSHFLIGDSLLSQPDENVTDAKISSLERYKLLAKKNSEILATLVERISFHPTIKDEVEERLRNFSTTWQSGCSDGRKHSAPTVGNGSSCHSTSWS